MNQKKFPKRQSGKTFFKTLPTFFLGVKAEFSEGLFGFFA